MGTAVNILIAICLCISANSKGVFANNCRRGCSQGGDGGVLKYENGHVYEYNFDSVLKIQMDDKQLVAVAPGDADADATALKVAGIAKLYAEGNCGYTLQLSGIKVTATKENLDKQLPAAIQKPVHFTLSNGQLEPQLCADPNDNEYALNIKRAIVSLFQATSVADGKHEIDVFGQCNTYTTSTQLGNTLVVNKVRNLNSCAYREQLHSGIISGVVNEKAGIHSSMLLLQADYNREVKIQNGLIAAVHLVENYKYASVRKGAPHIRAHVNTNLKLRQPKGAAANAPPTGATTVSIIYQKSDTHGVKNLQALKAQISEIVQQNTDYVQKESAKAIVELIRLMRNADAETLLELSNVPHPNKVLARKVYLDALFRTATKESARAILTQWNKLEDKEKSIALLSLNLVQVLDKETLQQAASLLNPNAPKEIYLVVGTLISKYCRNHECTAADKSIETLTKKLIDNLKHCRAATRKDEDRIVYVLKGIANSGNGHLDVNALVPVLNECIAPTNSMRIRVNALQAYAAAASCEPQLHQQGLQLLRNRNEDSELRIEAYLAVTTCPTAELANHIAEIVNSETVYQVGGFISSHLKALRDSTDQTREEQRHYLSNIRVTKTFPVDLDHYSYNSEISYKLAALGLSASIDTKLIYSQQGILPRSTRLNVTTEFFGTNFNVFDANVRQQNIEYLLEYFLGPKGVANQDFKDVMKDIDGSGRARRSIADETAKVAKKYKSFGNKNAQDINLDISVKMFNNELFFLSLGDRLPTNLADIIAHFSSVHEKLKNELNHFEQTFRAHILFIDTKLQYPTGVGIPLEFVVQGLAANRLDVALNVDVNALMQQDWSHAQPRIKIVPSVDVNIHVQLGFNAFVLETGVRLDSSFHSADGADVTISAINSDDSSGLNFAIELPRDKLELIDIAIQRDFYVAEQDKPLRSLANKEPPPQTPMCFNQLESLGLNFCIETTEIDYTGNIGEQLLVNGAPYKCSVYVTSERRFNVRAYHVPKAPNGSQQWKLEYSTPGSSKGDHNAALTLEMATDPRLYVRLEYVGNDHQVLASELGLSKTDNEVVLYTQVENSGQRRRSRIGFQKHGNEYRPLIEIYEQDGKGVRNDINGYRADGRIIIQEQGDNKRYQFEQFQLSNPSGGRLVVNGFVDLVSGGFDSDIRLGIGAQSYAVKTHLKTQPGLSVSAFINDERTPQNVWGVAVGLKVNDSEQKAEQEIELIVKAAVYELLAKHKLNSQYADNEHVVVAMDWDNELTLKRQQQIVVSGSIDGQLVKGSKLHLKGELTHGKKQGALSVRYEHGSIAAEKQFNLAVNAKYGKHFVDLQARGTPTPAQHLRIDGGLTSSLGTSITFKGDIGQRATLQDVHIDVGGSAQFTSRTKAFQYALKVIGAADRTNSELHLTQDGGSGELLSYTGTWTHAQERINGGKLQLHINNALQANGEFKLAKNGKGDISATIQTLNTEQPHKIDVTSKYHLQAPKYDFEATILYDGAQQLQVKTENVVEKLKLTTKNLLVLANGKQMKFDAHGVAKGEWVWNGELNGDFQLHTTCGHVIDGDFKRKMQTNAKTGQSHGSLELQLNDQLPAEKGGGKRSLNAHIKLDQFNWHQRNIVEDAQINYVSADGKNLKVHLNVKNVPTATNADALRKFELNTKLDGSLLQQLAPISVTVALDDYNSAQASYRIDAGYSNALQAHVQGSYHTSGDGGRGNQPCTFDVTANIQAPRTEFKKFELTANGKLLKTNHGKNGGDSGGGPYEIELHVNEHSGEGQQQFARLNIVAKGSRQQGNYKFDIHTSAMQAPLNIAGDYQREQQQSVAGPGPNAESVENVVKGKHTYNFQLQHGEQHAKSQTIIQWERAHSIELQYTLDSNAEHARHIEVHLQGHKTNEQSYTLQVNAQQNDKSYKLDSTVHRAPHKRGLEFTLQLPQQAQPIKLLGIGELLGERKGKLTIDIEHLFAIDLKADAEAAYNSIDDFYALAHWNSNKLNLKNYDLSVTAKSKTVQLVLKNAQGVVLSGNAAYALKTEQNKAIIEGQGQLQVRDQTQPISFKLVRQVYDLASDKEVGMSYTLNGNLGGKNGVSTLKVTNKEFNIKLSICEERKQCTNMQLQTSHAPSSGETGGVQNSLLMLLDLRELGYPYEFELQSRTIRQGVKMQYNLDASAISSNQRKYQLNAQWRPQGGHVQMQLPSREILFETKREHPTGSILGHYEHSFNFWLDKVNQPQDVFSIVASADVTGAPEQRYNAHGILKFQHPKVRTLSITGRVDANRRPSKIDAEIIFDIFRQPEQQIKAISRWHNTHEAGGWLHGFNITSEEHIVSSGLNLKYDFNGHIAFDPQNVAFSNGAQLNTGATNIHASYFLAANRDRVELTVNALDERLVQLLGEFDHQRDTEKWHATVQLFERAPLVVSHIRQPSLVKFNVQRANGIDFNAELELGKQLNVHLNGHGKQLLQGNVALDATNFLHTTYTSDKAALEDYWTSLYAEVNQETQAARDKLRGRFDQVKNALAHQRQLAKESLPDFAQLKHNYEQHANAIVKELEQDEAFKQLIQTYHEAYVQFTHLLTTLMKSGTELYEQVHKTLLALHEKIEEFFDKVLLPVWEDFLSAANNIVGELRTNLMVLYTQTAEVIFKQLEHYGPKLKAYIKAAGDVIRPAIETLQELQKTLTQLTDEWINDFKTYLAQVPTFEQLRAELQEHFERLQLTERILEFLQELFGQLHVLPQTPEVTEFLKRTQTYFEHKLKHQPVDDEHAIDELLKLLIQAVRSIWVNLLASNGDGSGSNGPNGSNAAVGHASDAAHAGIYGLSGALFGSADHLPQIVERLSQLFSFRFSVFNYLLNEDFSSHLNDHEHFATWLQSLTIDLHAHIVDGQHIFTFDNRYYGLNGNCRYVLAQDSVDNNFTVVGQFNNGKLKTITLTDRNGNFLEANDAGAIKLNGQVHEYPLHVGDMHAWRKYYTLQLRSEYGAELHCTIDLRICHLAVDMFYQSKLRGLFGNANYEPYDDFIKTDGRLARDAIEFSGAYALGGKCPAAVALPQPEQIQHNDICTELFGYESALVAGYLFLDTQPYRQACDVSVATAANDKDKEANACNIATAYVSALRVNEINVALPARCLKCSGGTANQRDFGTEFSVKIPNTKADVVFVVDLDVSTNVMAELVAPAINEVRETLKTRGLTDVQIAVIAYNNSEQYPALLSSDNGKLNYHGNLANVQLHGPLHTLQEYKDLDDVVMSDDVMAVFNVIKEIIEHLIPQADEQAYKMALNYPYRAGAAKSIVAVRSKPLSHESLLRLLPSRLTDQLVKHELPTLNFITPVSDLRLDGVPTERIIGFNSRIVALVDSKDARKRNKLEYKSDLSIEHVLSNNGWIFATQNFDALPAGERKKALNQVTTVIADTLYKTELQNDCKCVSVFGGLHAQHRCVVKSSNFVPNKKPKAAA